MIVDSEVESDSDENDGEMVNWDSESEAVELLPAVGACALCIGADARTITYGRDSHQSVHACQRSTHLSIFVGCR